MPKKRVVSGSDTNIIANEKTPILALIPGTKRDCGSYDSRHEGSSRGPHREGAPPDVCDGSESYHREGAPPYTCGGSESSHREGAPPDICGGSESSGNSSGEPDSVDDTGNNSSFLKMSTRQRWVLLLLALSNFATGACAAVQAPFFPAEASRHGMSPSLVGLVFGCFELWIVIASPFFGSFVHQMGVRFLFIGGLVTAGVCAILFGTLYLCPPGTSFIALCFFMRTCEALGTSAFSVASMAVVAHEFPAAVATVFGLVETFYGMGNMISPILGGVFFELGGYLLPFLVIGVLLIVCAALSWLEMPTKFVSGIQGDEKGPSMLQLLRSPVVLLACVQTLCACMAYNWLAPTLAPYLEQFNMSAVSVGSFFMAMGGVYAVATPLAGWLSDKKNLTVALLIGGNVFSLMGFLLVGPPPFLHFVKTYRAVIVVGVMMIGLGVGVTICPFVKLYFIGAKQLGLKDGLVVDGLVSGLVTAFVHLGMFAGPTLSSAVVQVSNFQWSCVTGAAVSLFATLCLTAYVIADKTSLKFKDYDDIEDDTTQIIP